MAHPPTKGPDAVTGHASRVERPSDAAGIGGRRDESVGDREPSTAVALAADAGAPGPGLGGLALATELADLGERARAYAEAARAETTRRAYRSDLRQFARWCAARGLTALPAAPDTVAFYLTAEADRLAVATLRRRLASLSVAHQLARHPTPTTDPGVQAVWAGIRRQRGAPPRKVTPLRTRALRAVVRPFGDALGDHRDRAMLVFLLAGGLRRSELVALDVEDLTEDPEGLRMHISGSKTDQEHAGTLLGLPFGSHRVTCPVRSWRAWLAVSGITAGPAFRAVDQWGHLSADRLSDRAVADMMARRAAAVGLAGRWAGHSGRAGYATEAYASGRPEIEIMRGGRWRSRQVMASYVAEGTLWLDNAAAHLGL